MERHVLGQPAYRATVLRASRPLVLLPQRLTDVTGPLLGAERVLPRDRMSANLEMTREVLLQSAEILEHLDADDVDAALDPARYLGSSEAFIDRSLGAHRTGPGAG